MSVIDTLLSRSSTKQIMGPGPSEDQIQQILATAMCAPDHGRLRPWRFKRIECENIDTLANLAVKAMAPIAVASANCKPRFLI